MKYLGWKLNKFTVASDTRGDLLAIEFDGQLPFVPKRFFATYNVPPLVIRGEHAHINCEQILVALAGEIRVRLDDGFQTQEFILDDPSIGLFVPKLTWGTQESLTSHSILGVFASHAYDELDYLRIYDQFLEIVRG